MELFEGAFRYRFNSTEWEADKYDTTSYYRRHLQSFLGGMKAVDFVAYQKQNRELWLIEIKDYRSQPREKVLDVFDEMAGKVRDTLAGLMVCSVRSTDSFQELARQALELLSIRIVLHLEQPSSPSRLFPQVIDPKTARDKMRQTLRAIDPHALVGDAKLLQLQVNWEIV